MKEKNMGSRIMHYAIAADINQHYKFGNSFLLGSIAPDVNSYAGTPKKLTHFIRNGKDGTRDIYPQLFIEEYGSELNPFQLGYYLHLISDKIWLSTLYKKYILGNIEMSRDEKLKIYYSDFSVLNSILIKKYNLSPLSIDNIQNIGVTEISSSYLPIIIKDLNSDFINKKINKTTMIKEEDVFDYIEQCINAFNSFLLQK